MEKGDHGLVRGIFPALVYSDSGEGRKLSVRMCRSLERDSNTGPPKQESSVVITQPTLSVFRHFQWIGSRDRLSSLTSADGNSRYWISCVSDRTPVTFTCSLTFSFCLQVDRFLNGTKSFKCPVNLPFFVLRSLKQQKPARRLEESGAEGLSAVRSLALLYPLNHTVA
jgi:hypothetical protein